MPFSLFNFKAVQKQEPEQEQQANPSQNLDNLEVSWEYWYPRVYGYFYKRVNQKEEVEDLTSNTLTTVFTAKGIQNLPAYMWRVAHNYLVKYINTKSTEPSPISLNEEWVSNEYNSQAEEIISDHYTEKITQLIKCVNDHLTKDEDKKLIQLSIMENKNSTEIGNILDIKPDNVRQKLSRTLKKLKQKCIQLWSAKSGTNNE
jgi:RNA polymerase sigma factor (sigma-70 family)